MPSKNFFLIIVCIVLQLNSGCFAKEDLDKMINQINQALLNNKIENLEKYKKIMAFSKIHPRKIEINSPLCQKSINELKDISLSTENVINQVKSCALGKECSAFALLDVERLSICISSARLGQNCLTEYGSYRLSMQDCNICEDIKLGILINKHAEINEQIDELCFN